MSLNISLVLNLNINAWNLNIIFNKAPSFFFYLGTLFHDSPSPLKGVWQCVGAVVFVYRSNKLLTKRECFFNLNHRVSVFWVINKVILMLLKTVIVNLKWVNLVDYLTNIFV